MKRIIIGIIALMFIFQPMLRADEGLWLPLLIERLNYQDMKEKGLQLTPEEIYSVNNSSLKDAIVKVGNGCTGGVISEKGLILTNHHCGHSYIQSHSSTEHDYLKNGFWARNHNQELRNEGLTASFLIRIEDVTKPVLSDVTTEMSESRRSKIISNKIDSLKKDATKGTHYKAVIKDFFDGNEYYMFIKEVYKDVRLVGAPPSSIGNFGGDTDNWMWPRHTGDFSLFRIYTAPDGSPAEYSEENIPLKPKYSLPVSLDGVKKGDFSMIMGYPGGTDRYMTSYGIDMNLNKVYPTRIKIRREKLDIIEKYMDKSDDIRIKYSSKHDQISNYWKYFKGMTKGLRNLNVPQKKKNLEKNLRNWISKTESRKEKYGDALSSIQQAYETLSDYATHRNYFIEAIYSGPEVLRFSRNFSQLTEILSMENPPKDSLKQITKPLKSEIQDFFNDYHKPVDKELMVKMFQMYSKNVPKEQQPNRFRKLLEEHNQNIKEMVEEIYAESIFDDKKKVEQFISDPILEKLTNDPAYKLQKSFFSNYFKTRGKLSNANAKKSKGRRHFMKALRKMKDDKTFYPDANGTMRLTYGTVQGYDPKDAVDYLYYTTLNGVMQKEDPNDKEFIVPDKLKEIYRNKNYGVYGDGDTMKVCFLTNHDITGGNSGSPVVDSKGNLIGLAFDGNWEAMSGDIAFEPELQRTINVDIRYVLLIIDKFAGAQNIMNELNLVNKPGKNIKNDIRREKKVEPSEKKIKHNPEKFRKKD